MRFARFPGQNQLRGSLFLKVFKKKKEYQKRQTSEKTKKSSDFVWEVCTSMSPRCSEMTTCFEKLQMSLAFSMVLRHLKAAEKVCEIADTR